MITSGKRLTQTVIVFLAICAIIAVIPVRGHAQVSGTRFISQDVAYVNGDVLTESELLFTLIRLFGEDTVYDLVEDEIIVSQADLMGIALDPNEVVEYLSSAYAPEKLASLLDAFGEDTLSRTVGTQLLALRTVTAKVDQIVAEYNLEVTDEEIRDFYIDGLPLWTTPAAVRFSLIETASQADAEAARQRIIAGEDFADVCREVSTHPGTAVYGGDIGNLVPQGYSTGERALLETTSFDLEPGEVSQPLHVEENWYLVTPTDKTEYNEPTLEEMYDAIHAYLLDEVVQPYLEEWLAGLFENAEMEITYPILTETPDPSAAVGEGGSFIAPTIGTVNGREIPEGALFFHLLRHYGSDVIKSIIEEMLFVQEGVGIGIAVSEAEAREEITDVYSTGLLQLLDVAFGSQAINRTFSRHLAALDVMGTKWQEIIEENGIEVTDEEVMQFYLDNLEQWVQPEMTRFSMIIVTSEEDAIAARQRITSGESFEAVCSEVSIDEQTRLAGGDIGGLIPRGIAGGAVEEAAFTLAIGSVSQPLQLGTGWFLIKVTDRTEAYEPAIGEMREDIYAAILEERVAPYLIGWRSLLWDNADIVVAYPIYVEPSEDGTSPGAGLLPGT